MGPRHSTPDKGGHTTQKVIAVIAARNEEKYIGATIDSLKKQTYPIHKIIVINDGSTDDTPIISKNAGCHIVTLPYHEEDYLSKPQLPAVWNKGLEIAEKYDPNFVLISGADQIYPPNYIEKLIENMNGRVAITSGEIAGQGQSKNPRGSGRLINAQYWKKISGLRFQVSPGWESYMINKFASCGLQPKVVESLVSIGRPLRTNPTKSLEEGRGMKAVGYHWFRALIRSLLLFLKTPKLGIQMLVGYYTYRGPYLDCSNYVRETQRNTLGNKIFSHLRGVLQ